MRGPPFRPDRELLLARRVAQVPVAVLMAKNEVLCVISATQNARREMLKADPFVLLLGRVRHRVGAKPASRSVALDKARDHAPFPLRGLFPAAHAFVTGAVELKAR